MTVCRRRAPMFSMRWFTMAAVRAISPMPSSVKVSDVPSAATRAAYCLVRAFSGSVMMRTKSASVSGFSSTRIGKRPCSSGIRSLGLLTWNAPAAMKSTWSVFTRPYFVCTLDPSTMGRRSRCTPSRDTSGPPISLLAPAILSISSRKMMPSFSTRSSASATTSSWLMSLSYSSSSRMRRASATVTVRRFFRLGMNCSSISPKLPIPSGAPCWAKSKPPMDDAATSISISRCSSWPSSRSCLSLSRVRLCRSRAWSCSCVTPPVAETTKTLDVVSGAAAGGASTGGGRSRSRMRSSTLSLARSSTSCSRSCRTMSMALSARSRTIPSTSRPT